MTMKKFFRTIHLYLGLASGIVIAIVCFTGAMLTFEKELQMFFYPERYTVVPGTARVPVEQMVETLGKKVPKADVTSVKVHDAADRSVEITYGKGKGKATQAFMNPYTGELIALQSQRNSFFYTMFSLHRWLLMDDVGKRIVGVSTLMFLVILITGIVLWWPKTWRIVSHRLKIKFDGGWKRLNHDLHIVTGFYTAIFLFAFAFTGLAWSFEWFSDGIAWVTGSPAKAPKPPHSIAREGAADVSLDHALAVARSAMPQGATYAINRPREADEQIFLDRHTAEVLAVRPYATQSAGQQVRSVFYAIHVGSIAGIPGRIIALLSCIAGFTFPITGVILWINRLRKKKTRAVAEPKGNGRMDPVPMETPSLDIASRRRVSDSVDAE
jgi:uncharacterized iron-regulated membrane protein